MDNFTSKLPINGTYFANPKYFIINKATTGGTEKLAEDNERLREVVTEEYL